MIDIRQSLTVAALLSAFVGCSKTESGPDGFPEDRVIRVTTEVGAMTRGYHTTENLTDFDLAVAGMGNARYSYDNTRFTRNADGTWSPVSQMLWESAGAYVDIFAFAPSNPSAQFRPGAQTPIYVSVQEVQTGTDNTSDVLYWGKTGFLPKDELVDGKISIEFRHVMSKLNLTVRMGTELNNEGLLAVNPISDVKISGTSLSAQCGWGNTYSYDALTLYPDAGTVKDITPYQTEWKPAGNKEQNSTVGYECILVPQSIGAGTFAVSFKAGDKAYLWTLPSQLTLEKNTVYTLTLQVGKDIVVAGEITAMPWDTTQDPQDIFTD